MENQENNNLIELEQLKAQYGTLKQQFDQQEIVNNTIIHEMLHAGISNFKHRSAEIIFIYGMLAATACWSWYYLDLRLPFLAISVLLFALTGLLEWFSCPKILHINIEDLDVQALRKKMDRASTRFSLLWITEVFALFLWMMWFISEIGDKLQMNDLRSSFVMTAIVLVLSTILIIINIGRLSKTIDEMLTPQSVNKPLSAQTSPSLKGNTPTKSTYYRSAAYWTGIVMLALNLIGLVFKMLHWPFANLFYMSVILVGPLFVILTARHLVRVLPNERQVIRFSEIAGLFLIISMVFKIMHFPFDNLLGLIGLLLLLTAFLIRFVKKRLVSD